MTYTAEQESAMRRATSPKNGVAVWLWSRVDELRRDLELAKSVRDTVAQATIAEVKDAWLQLKGLGEKYAAAVHSGSSALANSHANQLARVVCAFTGVKLEKEAA